MSTQKHTATMDEAIASAEIAMPDRIEEILSEFNSAHAQYLYPQDARDARKFLRKTLTTLAEEVRKEEHEKMTHILPDNTVSIAIMARAGGKILTTIKLVSITAIKQSDGLDLREKSNVAVSEILEALTTDTAGKIIYDLHCAYCVNNKKHPTK